ncbi:MAG: cytochrome c oxidase subunit II [Verrucomicrobia subdivision 3 bacterium]|nr:cytochrome c oxidase subunit II [Limisphaerales bacterium]
MPLLEQLGIPVLASEHGKDVDSLILWLHYLMALLFVGWTAYFLYAIWRFRSSRNPKGDYVGVTNHSSSYIEVAVAIAEGILLFGLAVPLWSKAATKFPDPKESTIVRIIAKQFDWWARYPGADGVFGSNRIDLVTAANPMGMDTNDAAAKDDVFVQSREIAVPVNKPVIAYVSSLDVIHSFKVSPLRVTQDANPGMSIPIHFKPTLTNTYFIQCSQLCGNGHYGMWGHFKVLGTNEYAEWLKSKSGAAAVSYE